MNPPEKEMTETDACRMIDNQVNFWIEKEHIHEVPLVSESYYTSDDDL